MDGRTGDQWRPSRHVLNHHERELTMIAAIFSIYSIQACMILFIFFFYVYFLHRRLMLVFMPVGFLLFLAALSYRFFMPNHDYRIAAVGTSIAFLFIFLGTWGKNSILNLIGSPPSSSRSGTAAVKQRLAMMEGIEQYGVMGSIGVAGPALAYFVPPLLIGVILAVTSLYRGFRDNLRLPRWFGYGFSALVLGELFAALHQQDNAPIFLCSMSYVIGFTLLIFSLWKKAMLSFNLRYFLTSLLTGAIGICSTVLLFVIFLQFLDIQVEGASSMPALLTGTSCFILLLLFFPSWRAAMAFSLPISDIIAQTQSLKEGKLEPFRANLSSAEYNQLIESLNIMVRAIDKNRDDLESKITQLKELDRLREEFLANVSHELRTPLTMIIGNSELLLAGLIGDITEEQREFLQPVYDEAHKLLQLITDVLNFSKIERGLTDVHLDSINVPELVDSVLTQYLPLARHRQIKIYKEVHVTTLGSDKEKIRQILVHLIGNAMKFNAKGGKARVRVRELKGDDGSLSVEFQVSDTGIGIHPEFLPSLFDKFRQEDGSATREFGGTGIGLTIVKSFSELLQGTVDVKSVVGKGSQFTVTIPHQNVAESVKACVSPRPESSRQNTLVMVIEGDPNITKLLKTYLVHGGYNAVALSSGSEVLEQAERLNPHVICINPSLPDMNGWELIKRLRKSERNCSTPILIITATDNRTLATKLGIDDYLILPVKRSTFLETIDAILSR